MENKTPTHTIPWYQKLATIVGLLVGAALILPTLGGIFLGPSQLRELKDLDKDKERRIVSLEQIAREHTKDLSGIYGRMERLENIITNGNQRTESAITSLLEKFAELRASAGMMERSVSTLGDVVHSAHSTSKNAVVRADKALDIAEEAQRASATK